MSKAFAIEEVSVNGKSATTKKANAGRQATVEANQLNLFELLLGVEGINFSSKEPSTVVLTLRPLTGPDWQ